MGLFITGDVHSDVESRFSFKRNPNLRELTENDFMFIAGDFGVIWDYHGNSKQDRYGLRFVNSKPWTTIVITGNHENYDIIEQMPQIEKFGGVVRQCVYMGEVYDRIYIVDKITTLDIEGQHILCFPKAESHDIWNLLDPNEPDFKAQARKLRKLGQWYRVVGQSWWPQEKMNVEENMNFMEKHENEHFDIIISHDAPGSINQWFSRGYGRYVSTKGERYLEVLRSTLDFDSWIHGHFHFDGDWPGDAHLSDGSVIKGYDQRMYGIYKDILQLIE